LSTWGYDKASQPSTALSTRCWKILSKERGNKKRGPVPTGGRSERDEKNTKKNGKGRKKDIAKTQRKWQKTQSTNEVVTATERQSLAGDKDMKGRHGRWVSVTPRSSTKKVGEDGG